MHHSTRSNGFTIIELVVVILILGVLAMTALPRFMDVSDEAHQAIMENLLGNASTGVALFRATWIAEGGTPGALVEGYGRGDLYAQNNNLGDPAGFDDATVDNDTCFESFQGILHESAPEMVAAVGLMSTDAERETAIENSALANPSAEILTRLDTTSGTFNGQPFYGCILYYIGQHRSGTPADPRTIQVILSGSNGSTRVLELSTFELKR